MKIINRKTFVNTSLYDTLVCENKSNKYYEEFNVKHITKRGKNEVSEYHLQLYLEYKSDGKLVRLDLKKEDAEKDRYIYNKYIWYIK